MSEEDEVSIPHPIPIFNVVSNKIFHSNRTSKKKKRGWICIIDLLRSSFPSMVPDNPTVLHLLALLEGASSVVHRSRKCFVPAG